MKHDCGVLAQSQVFPRFPGAAEPQCKLFDEERRDFDKGRMMVKTDWIPKGIRVFSQLSRKKPIVKFPTRSFSCSLRTSVGTGDLDLCGRKAPPVMQRAAAFADKTAIIDHDRAYSYKELITLSAKLSQHLQAIHRLEGERIAFITPNDASYVVSKWATWMSGAISVPLCKTHPPQELCYVLENSKTKVVVSTPEFSDMMQDLSGAVGADHVALSKDFMDCSMNGVKSSFGMKIQGDAMLIYTSGTTGRPKGVLWTHSSLDKQVDMMVKSWKWSMDDTILHVLPLHHFHGIINALICPLAVGATVMMKDKFMPNEVWDHLLEKTEDLPPITVFMAVPTIYAKLLQYHDIHLTERSHEIAEKCKEVRLMVSGSAALPAPVYQRWKDLTSHDLLERYGMTEIGMSLTNSYHGKRLPGFVGLPFPGQEVKIVSELDGSTIVSATSEEVIEYDSCQQGELFARGAIFKEYWENPTATEEAFSDGWFKTGDTAACENGSFKIIGRTSVDIIKSGGYKIGALDIERILLDHPNIVEVAVLGVPDDMWGQVVGTLVVLKNTQDSLTLEGLKDWCKPHMSPYCMPKILKTISEIPKNAMGKVNKKELVKLFR